MVVAAAPLPDAQPEAATGFAPRPAVQGRTFMAVTANPHATAAAVDMLELGGNAVDAALAAQWVLNLVEPQSSGIGGGGFLLNWDAARSRLAAWDGRETAPATATPDLFLQADGSPAKFEDIVATGRSVGAPGLVAMLEAAHRKHGRLVWARSFRTAIRLAENGFPMSPRLHQLLKEDRFLRHDPAAFALYYLPSGEPRPVGEVVRNPALAATFRALAAGGSAAMQTGPLAQRMVDAVAARGGKLSAADLGAYRPVERPAVCGPYRQWRVCSMPPPSSGGVTVLQMLGIIERAPVDDAPLGGMHRFAEAGRLAYADRARYLADPDFVSVPLRAMLAPDYLAARAKLIRPERSMGIAKPGEMARSQAADDDALELPATTHLSIVDVQGNAVALTSSIESAFGSRIQVEGFLLNNQLTDFSFVAEREGKPVANRVEAGKRPLSSMSPTLVFAADGKVHAVLGSPGGARIINYVAYALLGLLDDGLAPADLLARPHIGNRNGATEIERGSAAERWAAELERRGHTVSRVDMTSGIHLIVRTPGGWLGAVDPRREGRAQGD